MLPVGRGLACGRRLGRGRGRPRASGVCRRGCRGRVLVGRFGYDVSRPRRQRGYRRRTHERRQPRAGVTRHGRLVGRAAVTERGERRESEPLDRVQLAELGPHLGGGAYRLGRYDVEECCQHLHGSVRAGGASGGVVVPATAGGAGGGGLRVRGLRDGHQPTELLAQSPPRVVLGAARRGQLPTEHAAQAGSIDGLDKRVDLRTQRRGRRHVPPTPAIGGAASNALRQPTGPARERDRSQRQRSGRRRRGGAGAQQPAPARATQRGRVRRGLPGQHAQGGGAKARVGRSKQPTEQRPRRRWDCGQSEQAAAAAAAAAGQARPLVAVYLERLEACQRVADFRRDDCGQRAYLELVRCVGRLGCRRGSLGRGGGCSPWVQWGSGSVEALGDLHEAYEPSREDGAHRACCDEAAVDGHAVGRGRWHVAVLGQRGSQGGRPMRQMERGEQRGAGGWRRTFAKGRACRAGRAAVGMARGTAAIAASASAASGRQRAERTPDESRGVRG